jgi:hypothetical protein
MPAWSRHWIAGMCPLTPSTTMAMKLPLLSTCLQAMIPPSGVSMWSILTSWILRPLIPPALFTPSAHTTRELSYQELMNGPAAPLYWANTLILIDVGVTPTVLPPLVEPDPALALDEPALELDDAEDDEPALDELDLDELHAVATSARTAIVLTAIRRALPWLDQTGPAGARGYRPSVPDRSAAPRHDTALWHHTAPLRWISMTNG